MKKKNIFFGQKNNFFWYFLFFCNVFVVKFLNIFDNHVVFLYNNTVSDCEINAPAKVNFGLKVMPRREDGFHAIESVFQTVSLCDVLHVKLNENEKCNVTCGELKLEKDNTVALAYKAFRDVVRGDLPGVDITIEKRILAGGGLGGGSSDAAAFIKAFANLCDIRLTDSQKKEIASRVGSDVFFFLEAETGCALVSGRGEIVRAIEPRDDLFLLLVFPGVTSGTKEAYGLIDSNSCASTLKYPAFAELESVYRKPVAEWDFVNSFTPVIACRYPEVARALDDVKKSGACYAEMSGSGSTVYGIFASLDDAEDARETLSKYWQGCAVVEMFR